MRCVSCGFENPAGTKFCGECGNSFLKRCPNCGAENPARFKFCGECGTSLAERSRAQGLESEAEGYFVKAIEVARRQQTKSSELRATTSLARLWQQQGKTIEAHQMLAEMYGWFTEGFETRDLQEAKALLEALT